MHMVDSQASLGVLTECRTTSYQLRRVLPKINVLVLVSHALPVYTYAATEDNPADLPSRVKLQVCKRRRRK